MGIRDSVNGQLLTGSGCGGVAGHSVLVQNGRRCTCGRRDCLEVYASATALIRDTREQLWQHPQSLLVPLNRKVREYCFAGDYLETPVVETAKLKNTAGIIGAASLIKLKEGEET